LFFVADFDFADLLSRFVGWWQGVSTSSSFWVRSSEDVTYVNQDRGASNECLDPVVISNSWMFRVPTEASDDEIAPSLTTMGI
jgi:hypothetical protein